MFRFPRQLRLIPIKIEQISGVIKTTSTILQDKIANKSSRKQPENNRSGTLIRNVIMMIINLLYHWRKYSILCCLQLAISFFKLLENYGRSFQSTIYCFYCLFILPVFCFFYLPITLLNYSSLIDDYFYVVDAPVSAFFCYSGLPILFCYDFIYRFAFIIADRRENI